VTTAAAWIAGVDQLAVEPMHADESDAIYDDVYDAMHDDRALLPEGFWFLFAAFRTLAQTNADPDGFAAQTCRQLVQRARTGVPMNEPEGEL
jgi:hypothetical protein